MNKVPVIAISRHRMKTDGDGVTTLVCFHGCPLRCVWCINPFSFAEDTNARKENIGARRLYTILEKILADISFEAPDRAGQHIVVDKAYVEAHLDDVKQDVDLRQFVL